MKINVIQSIIEKMKPVCLKSNINQKHAAVVVKKGKIITPIFHNYKRNKMFGTTCGSAHSEMCVLNYILNKFPNIKQCVL
jgi:pyrimidine deaminase RibD-like protein